SKESENGPEPMYPYYTLGSGKMVPTTLNVYGVAVAHLWAETGYFTRPNYTAVHLPAGVPYRMLLYYKVTVKSPYGKVYGGGWYMEGAEAKIGVEETVVLLGGGRRAVFTRWAGDATSSSPSVTIVVDRDYEIEAEWRLQYYVEIITPFSRPTLTPGWHDAGSILEVGLEEYVVTFRNATRRLFVKWAGKWAGDVESPEKKVVVEVSGPLTLEAVWKTQYYVEVIPGYGSASIESDWYDEGLEIALSINRVLIDYGNSTRLVFRSWLIDGVVHEERSVMLRLSKPYVAKALWTKEYEVYVRLLDRGFSELDGSALLVTNGVELPVRSGSSTWLRKGLWTVGGASYVELPRVSTLSPSPGPIALEAQALDELLEVSGPGVVDVRLDVGRVDVYVKDLLGVPCPLITISLGGLVDATSDLQGFAFSLRLPRGSYVVELGLMNLPLGSVSIDVSGGGVVVVAAPLSIYTGLAIFAALIAASMVAKLRLRS
ncbi:MAG: hypothetical protein N3H31_05825, partial [Candidatus Nezhaarchaeota archaeon]|nr:hypothetical protein [Candidatus Nezhaarchaeota archaeon]